jgi:hypothetical protein
MADKLEEGHHAKRSAAAKDAFKLESPAQPTARPLVPAQG